MFSFTLLFSVLHLRINYQLIFYNLKIINFNFVLVLRNLFGNNNNCIIYENAQTQCKIKVLDPLDMHFCAVLDICIFITEIET